MVKSSGSCINVDNASNQVGIGIDQWSCTGASNQIFRFTATLDGYYTIQPYGNGMCIDAGIGSVTVGTQVAQQPCSGGNSQKWWVSANSDNSYVIRTFTGEGCLDVYAGRTANGTAVTTYACHVSSNETFTMSGFRPVTVSVAGTFVSPMVIQSSGSCINVSGGSNQAGAGIDEWTCSGANNQSFAFTPTPDGYYNINPQNSGLCMDAGSGSVTTGKLIVQNICSGGTFQKWRLTANGDGSYSVSTNDGTGCIDVYAGRITNGTTVTTYTCHNSSNEHFLLTRSSPSLSPTPSPTILPAAGSYLSPLTVIITPAASGTTVYYSTDGSVPTAGGRLYSSPLLITAPTTVKAIAVAGGGAASQTVSNTYTVTTPTPAPSVSPATGSYTSPLRVTITPAVSGTPVYYSTDGSIPTASARFYSGPLLITASTTVRAIAVADGIVTSQISSNSYIVTGTTPTPGSSTTAMVIESSGSCVNVDAGSNQVGRGIDQWTCSGASNQRFVFISTSDGYYSIQPQNSGLCLDAGSGAVTTGIQVIENICSNGSSQKWRVLANSNGSYSVSTFTGEGCFDVYAGRVANGTPVTTYACHESTNENFLLAGFTPGFLPASPAGVPIIINYSPSARPGNVVYVQGVNFDPTSQVRLGTAAAIAGTRLSVVNSVGSTWLAAQIPQAWYGAMFLWISNSSGNSLPVKLNGALPFHLDALQLVPGGAFRVLGRNLMMTGYIPSVTVDGRPALVNINASTENMLLVTAPSLIGPNSNTAISVDNGNGTGAAKLDRAVDTVAGSGDPFNLGVGWGAGFTFAGRKIVVKTPCSGTLDDSGAIQSVINAAANGGGVVQLPAGRCILMNSLTLRSNVVLQGAGKDVTTLEYRANYPVSSQRNDLVGIRNLTIINAGMAQEGLIWKQNTRSFFQSVKIAELVSRQLYLTGNRDFVVTQTDFVQTGSIGGQNPYLFTDCAGFVFSNNTSVTVNGSPTFSSVHDALVIDNHFSRNSMNQNEAVVITAHQFVMDFAYRTTIIGNTFDVINGPITNTRRNDGETLLTEGGGGNRTENSGTVVSATFNTLADPANIINVNPFGNGLPENYGVAIVSGTGAGQTREVMGYISGILHVDRPWDIIPDKTSHYATFVWGLEKVVIVGNTLVGNPRGIWLYQAAVRDVDISGNTIINGGGIFLRTFESQAAKQFDPMYNVRVANNSVSNSDHVWMSYVNAVFVNKDASNFGTAVTGLEILGNNLVANNPNVTSTTEDYAGNEGFMNVMRSETSGGRLTGLPMLLGTVLQANQCLSCASAFVIGTGDYGTVLVGNTPLPGSPRFLSDWQTLGPNLGGSVGTVIR